MSDFNDDHFPGVTANERFNRQYHRLLLRAVMNVDIEIGIPRATQDVIASLPFRKVRESELVGVDPKCSVCMESLQAGEILKSMPCKHEFHDQCLIRWLKESYSCLLCRFQLKFQELTFTRVTHGHLAPVNHPLVHVYGPFRRSEAGSLRRSLTGPSHRSQDGSRHRLQDDSNSSDQDDSDSSDEEESRRSDQDDSNPSGQVGL
ncbi:GL24353 [Drosophila persimilis]|uniref:GL24353 n=1 Tax=Drosophila persimilis TaxID=7234 RepID=B4G5G1_DROPE|nr:GL24353 [Drosophila persimilis]